MTPLAFYRHLLSIGTPEDAAYDIAAKFEASEADKVRAIYEGMLASLTKDAKADERRRKDRERKAAKKAGIPQNSADSTGKAGIPQNAEPAKDAPAHVRDNLPRLVTSGKISSAAGDCASDWPENPPGGWAKHLASLAGPGLADIAKAPGLTTTAGEIIRWRQMGCSWAEDVVPTVAGRTLRPRPSPIASWTLLTSDVLAAKARRERPIEVPEATGPPAGSFSAQRSAESAESTRRVIEMLKANG